METSAWRTPAGRSTPAPSTGELLVGGVLDRARGQLRLSWLDLDGSPIAAEYHFTDGATTFAYQGGVDPDRLAERCRPYYERLAEHKIRA